MTCGEALVVRALDRDVRELLRNRIVELVELLAKSFGVTAKVEFLPGYPVLVNTLIGGLLVFSAISDGTKS